MTWQPTRLKSRSILEITGKDARGLLQDVLTNDLGRLKTEPAIFCGLLTPQGKVLFDFILAAHPDDPANDQGGLLVDCEAACADALRKRLMMYKLRADMAVTDRSEDLGIAIGTGKGFADPRHPTLPDRLIAPAADLPDLDDESAYHLARIIAAVPEGSGDVPENKIFALEARFEEQDGVDFKKGCYVGQEQTARMKHRGTLKKTYLPFRFDGPAPEPDTPLLADDKEIGTTYSHQDDLVLCWVRTEKLDDAIAENKTLTAGGASLAVFKASDQ